jgi:hypothetical protein
LRWITAVALTLLKTMPSILIRQPGHLTTTYMV